MNKRFTPQLFTLFNEHGNKFYDFNDALLVYTSYKEVSEKFKNRAKYWKIYVYDRDTGKWVKFDG